MSGQGLDVDVLTIFPHMFPGPLGDSITGRALASSSVRLRAVDIREFATDRHRSTDDYSYGGGPGMVMRPEPLVEAIGSVRRPASRLILLSPAGRRFDQARRRAADRSDGLDQRPRSH